jgi:hypothetical protein
MKKLIFLIFFIITDAYSETFSLSKMEVTNAKIEIITAKNVTKNCEAESRKRNLGGFGYSVDGCAFWDDTNSGRVCTIVIGTTATNDLIAHEVRHCFQGQYHK